MELSDERLLEHALEGDGACFGELARRWQRRIYGFICRYVGNREEARDLTQDTFAKAFQNLDRLADSRRFPSWLYKIALNECRMRFRRQNRGVIVPLEEYVQREERGGFPTPTPEDTLEAGENVRILRQAVAQLPEEQRVVIVMKEYQGLKFHEIAEILDLPLSTVKSRMYLGLKTLKKLVERKL